ncbi:MAG: O-antigen ligase family protein, partial [Halieaceae bacterium]|nr:O-antigen ligase family protein [Halieaceae bacterium]
MLITDKAGGYCFAALLAASIIQLTDKNKYPFTRTDSWVVLILACYPFVVLLNLFSQPEFRLDDFDDTSRFLLVIPIYLALRYQAAALHYASLGALAGLLAAIFLAIMAMLAGTETRFGGYENPVAFSQAAVLLACLSGCISINASQKEGPSGWSLAVIALISTSFTSLASQTRTTILSAMLLMPLAFPKSISLKNKLIFLSFSVVIFTFLCVALLKVFGAPHITKSSDKIPEIIQIFIKDGPHQTVETLLKEDSTSMVSLGRRGALWIVGYEAMLANPIFGIGKGNFQEFVQKSKSLNLNMKDSVSIYSHAHNDIIQITAEIGIVGLVSYIILLLGSIVIVINNSFDLKSRRLVFMTITSCFIYGL